MYCQNCGKENDDGVVFCSQCGKSPHAVTVTDTGAKAETGWTVELIRNCFPWVFVVMFWLSVGGAMIGGAKIARGLYALSNPYDSGGGDGAMVVGGLIGLICGFIVAVWAGGVVATLLKMDRNLQYLADKEKAKG